MVRRSSIVMLTVLALLACDPEEPSDEDQYMLDIGLERPLGTLSHHVLIDSTFRASIHDVIGHDVTGHDVIGDGEVDPDGGGLLCAALSGSGVLVEIADQEFRVEGAGAGAIEIADPSIACPQNDDVLAELEPDRWAMIGVEPPEAVGRWVYWPDGAINTWPIAAGRRGVFPDDVGHSFGELRVVADSPFSAIPMLALAGTEESSDEVEVRWEVGAHELALPEHYEYLNPRIDDDPSERRERLQGVLPVGHSFDTSSLELHGLSFALPPVRAVPVEEIATLELIPVYGTGDAQREWGRPAGAIAVTRDAQGRRIVSAPVEFELTDGSLTFEPATDYVLLDDSCRPSPSSATARTATLRATLGELEREVELEWIALPEDGVDGDDPPDTCAGNSCSCTSAPAPVEAPLTVLLLVLGVGLRRRPSRS